MDTERAICGECYQGKHRECLPTSKAVKFTPPETTGKAVTLLCSCPECYPDKATA